MSYIPQEAIEEMIRKQVEPVLGRVRTLECKGSGTSFKLLTPSLAIVITLAIVLFAFMRFNTDVVLPMQKVLLDQKEQIVTLSERVQALEASKQQK